MNRIVLLILLLIVILLASWGVYRFACGSDGCGKKANDSEVVTNVGDESVTATPDSQQGFFDAQAEAAAQVASRDFVANNNIPDDEFDDQREFAQVVSPDPIVTPPTVDNRDEFEPSPEVVGTTQDSPALARTSPQTGAASAVVVAFVIALFSTRALVRKIA